MLVGFAPAAPAKPTGPTRTYVVLYRDLKVTGPSLTAITASGGKVRGRYGSIGVAVVTSSSRSFRGDLMRKDRSVLGAAATDTFGVQLKADQAGPDDALPGDTPAADSDSLSGLQWDMVQIHTPEAHAISGGSPSITVGDIDTGLDYTHPDLAPNVDFANSVSCLGGVPNTSPSAWMDQNGHGTHTAGTIAAAANGIGIVGVAPNAKIAGIRAGNADGFFFPEAVICSFMWAGSHNIPITNNSYFADPWLYNCRNDAEQRAIWIAERRAIQYAQNRGTLVVAAEGNDADDLTHPTADATSPDDTDPVLRQIHNDCAVVPVEVPGVVVVSASGNLKIKSFYSSYGIGVTDVMAPGGDSILQLTAAAPNGRVLSTWPSSLLNVTCLAARRLVDASGATYCYQQGTSMAAPHVAGVAALIESHLGITSPGPVASRLAGTADQVDCPSDISIYAFFPSFNSGAPQACTGDLAYNSFAGHGEVNALTAIS
jgi:subtilisin family serine protease